MGRRRAGPEDSVPFREGRQVPGARAAAPGEGRQRWKPRRGRGPQGVREADAPGGGGLEGGAGRSVPAARALAPAPAGSARPPRRRGRACPGPGAAAPPSAYHGWRGARGSGRGARAAGGRAARGWLGAAEAAGEGALALPRWPLLSVCVCSKMAARLAPRDADAGPQGRPLRRHRLPPRPGRLRPTRPRPALRAPCWGGLHARRPRAPRHVTREPGRSRDAGLAAVAGGGVPGVLPGYPLTRDARPPWSRRW